MTIRTNDTASYNRIRDLTDFLFFKNTPLTNFTNTIHFDSNEERDKFFIKENHYQSLNFKTRFNFVRDMSTIRVPANIYNYGDLQNVNYCTFLSEFEPKTRYYAFVVGIKYINHGTTEINLLIDPVMTFTQGSVLNSLLNINVLRQHLSKSLYNNSLNELKRNDDVLNCFTKNYKYERGIYFNNLLVLIQSTADLTKEFGTENQPKITSSTGCTFDKVTSPVDLYMIHKAKWIDFSKQLASYPWIAQNLVKIILIPACFFDESKDFDKVTPSFDFDGLYKLKNEGASRPEKIIEKLKGLTLTRKTINELLDISNPAFLHLARNGYFNIELYAWDGQKVALDSSCISKDLEFTCEKIVGYENEIAIYPKGYNASDYDDVTRETEKGSYLNSAIIFKNFDSVPVLINAQKLAWAKSANQRALAEKKLVTNRISNVLNNHSDLQSRFFDSASLISNFSPMNLFGKFTDEYEFYRTQQAQFKDMALDTPTLTQQTNSNSFQIANNNFGITMKIASPDIGELEKIKKYYAMFGYKWERYHGKLDNVHSMTICNYVKFSGNWTLPNINPALIEMMKAQFENGILLWHNNNTNNPFVQNPINNTFRS